MAQQGIKLANGVLTLGMAPNASRFNKEIVIFKRDENGKKTDKKVSCTSNSGAKLNWFMVSNGGEPRKQDKLTEYMLEPNTALIA